MDIVLCGMPKYIILFILTKLELVKQVSLM